MQFPLTLISIRSELSCAPISLKVSYSRGIEFHTVHSPSDPPGRRAQFYSEQFPVGKSNGNRYRAVCKGQTPVSLCTIRSLQGKGDLTRYREKKRGERERESERREGKEETLRGSERSVGNQFPRRITTVVRSLFVTLSLPGEPDRDLDSFSADCEPRE